MLDVRISCHRAAWLLIGICGAAFAAERPATAPAPLTSRTQVVLSVARDLHLPVEFVAERLQLLGRLPEPGLEIRVISARQEPFGGEWVLRLACEPSCHSLPFDVLLNAPKLNLAHSAGGGVAVVGMSAKTPASLSAGQHGPRLVHKGEKVQLVGQFGDVKLVFHAVCLEGGTLGDRVRVRNASGRRVLVATVVAPKTLSLGVETQ